MPDMFQLVTEIDLTLSVIGLILLAYLLYVYLRLYSQLRQRFTLGFVVFTILLLAHNLSATFYNARRLFFGTGFRDRPPPVPPGGFDQDATAFLFFRLIPSVFEFVAILVLVWLTRE